MERLKTKIFSKEVQSPVFIGAGPATEHAESCISAIENGAGAVEMSFMDGRHEKKEGSWVLRGDGYAILPQKADGYNGRYYGLMSTGMWYTDIHEGDNGDDGYTARIKKVRAVSDANKGRALIVASIGSVGYDNEGVYSWADMARIAEQEAGADAITLHIQTGNAMAGGLFSRDSKYLPGIVESVRKATKLPVIAKLPVEGCEPQLVADLAHDLGVDATASTGRLISLEFDINTRACKLGGFTGFGGSFILPNTLAWAARMYKNRPNRVLIPGGGVSSWEDIIKVVMAGGTMMQACTWPMINGYSVIGKALKQVDKWMSDNGYNSLDEVRGVIALSATPSPELWKRNIKRVEGPMYGIKVNKERCVGCGKCLPNCYFHALNLENGKMQIIPDKCVGCGCCHGTCPFDAIE